MSQRFTNGLLHSIYSYLTTREWLDVCSRRFTLRSLSRWIILLMSPSSQYGAQSGAHPLHTLSVVHPPPEITVIHSTSDDSSLMITTSSTPRSPAAATLLSRDAFQVVCTFLEWKDFIHTCLAHRLWYSAGCHMKSRARERKFYGLNYGRRNFTQMIQSPLRIHINHLILWSLNGPEDLHTLRLRDSMGHLESLTLQHIYLRRDDVSSPVPVLNLPPRLKELSLGFNGHFLNATEKNISMHLAAWVKQIADESTRLLKLDVICCGCMAECPQELRSISTLTNLAFWSAGGGGNLNQQIDFVKSMPSLHYWYPLRPLLHDHIQRLVDGSPDLLQLEDIGPVSDWGAPLDDATMRQLRRLPTLTKLDITWMTQSDPNELFPYLKRLLDLKVTCSDIGKGLLSTALSTCVTLTSLELHCDDLTNDDLCRCLPHLVSLVKLTLFRCSGLDSLQFLDVSKTSLTHLTTFEIKHSNRVPLKEYDLYLHVISSSLESLTIDDACLHRWPQSMIDRLTPGSPEFRQDEWPRLTKFELHEVEHDDEEEYRSDDDAARDSHECPGCGGYRDPGRCCSNGCGFRQGTSYDSDEVVDNHEDEDEDEENDDNDEDVDE